MPVEMYSGLAAGLALDCSSQFTRALKAQIKGHCCLLSKNMKLAGHIFKALRVPWHRRL